MAAGEYVSVSSQADAEEADIAKERHELATDLEHEREELVRIYQSRGLDRALAEQVTDQFMKKDALKAHLRDELGLSILIVTHDLGLAWNVADRIAVMYLGRIIEEGTTEEVLSEPKHPYTQALLASTPGIVGSGAGLPRTVLTGELPSPLNPPNGCVFSTRCPHAVERCRAERPLLRAITWRRTWASRSGR